MDKKALKWHFETIAHHDYKNLCEGCIEISRLISSSEPEVGDKEKAKLLWHFNKCVSCEFEVEQETIPPERLCPLCQQIRALLRQRRTVSREQVDKWAAYPFFPGEKLPKFDDRVHFIKRILTELSYKVEEKT